MSKLKTALRLLKSDRQGFIRSFVMRFSNTRLSHLVSDKAILKIQYKAHFARKLNLKNPQTFNEKLQWLKLYHRDPEQIKLVDKYEVKKYIAEVIGEEYIIPTLGIYDNFDDIDFSLLPEKFVLKCTHDSGSVVICRDKSKFDIESAKNKLTRKLKMNLFWHGREWPYKNVKPQIMAEAYMEDSSGKDLTDYKFFCFSGEPKFLYVSSGLSNHETARISYVSLDWERMPFKRSDFAEFEELPPKPVNLEKMIEYSKILSKDFPFLRVDFYEINGEIYFGELTFFPGSGFTAISPPEWDEKIGGWLILPDEIIKSK